MAMLGLQTSTFYDSFRLSDVALVADSTTAALYGS